jgi:phage N-6-adenine-methyltransferase
MTPEQLAAWFSSSSCEWGTPQWLFNVLHEREHFTLDVCASEKNHKLPRYYTREDDCFTKPWDGVWFCNPVYGDAEEPCHKTKCKKKRCKERGFCVTEYQPGIADFVEYGIEQAARQKSRGVYLVPARVDTEWFETLFRSADEVLFIHGRLRYEDNNRKPGGTAPFPSCIVAVSSAPKKFNRPTLVDIWSPDSDALAQ